MVWPWEQFDWGMFWALIAAFVVADFFKSAFAYLVEKLGE